MKRRPDRVPKLNGADVELANFLVGTGRTDTSDAASRLLLGEIDGIAANSAPVIRLASAASSAMTTLQPSAVVDPQDQGRKFLPTTGGSWYLDLQHCEGATAETLSARDHVAMRHAMLRVAQRAQAAVNAWLPEGQRLEVLVNNSVGDGTSWGSHLNFLVSRRAYDNLFSRRLHHLLYLASYQVSSIVFAGAGKVGAENGAPAVDFGLTQRGDFMETLLGWQTTYRRPIVNARDEALAGPTPGPYARLHVIFYDSQLSPAAMFLTTGVMQIVLAMIEAERIDDRLILDDPLEALTRWGHDPELRVRARTAIGRRLTAVEHQLGVLDQARRFVEAGGCDGLVPEAHAIVALWADTLERLRKRDFESLAGRLDWVQKWRALTRARARRPGLTWRSPEMKMLDDRYASLDPAQGLFWAYQRAGAVEQVVSEERIRHFETEPPSDTRAWTRAMLLRLAGAARTDAIDWDWIRFRTGRATFRKVALADPLGFTAAATQHVFTGEPALGDVLDALAAIPDDPTALITVPTAFH